LSGKQYAWRPTIWFAAKGDHQKMVTMREQHKNTISGVGLQSSQREKRKVQTGHWLRHYILQVPMSVGTFLQIQIEMYQTIGKPPVRRVS
jgi:hypothetical protein